MPVDNETPFDRTGNPFGAEAGWKAEDVVREVRLSKHDLHQDCKVRRHGGEPEAKQLRGESTRLRALVADLSMGRRYSR